MGPGKVKEALLHEEKTKTLPRLKKVVKEHFCFMRTYGFVTSALLEILPLTS